ncbi:hypothetical protein [Paraburkholderia bryophila]|uniref:Uncharacterized protein YaaW (UPF0174 family) n=1 Tax=Paraburkholderia bryophila TaxID=420952 RepID=A0A7Z0B5L6_9BURK|nr:hypothetical protein [Paraburkholderia bryophila]NYH22461.1 uncharacterized protein YaaW (UPF0174 family) [Paraburkholderia bryophila]
MNARIPLITPDTGLLPLLSTADKADLAILVQLLNRSSDIDLNLYITDGQDVAREESPLSAHDVAAEIQRSGGNSFANALRGGKGVKYIEVARDVANRVGVPLPVHSPVDRIEQAIVRKLFLQAYEPLSLGDRQSVLVSAGIDADRLPPGVTPMVAIQAAFSMGNFASYQLTLIVTQAVTRHVLGTHVSASARTPLARALALFSDSIGRILTCILTAWDIAGPAWRVTLPCVVYVAHLRQKTDLKPRYRR